MFEEQYNYDLHDQSCSISNQQESQYGFSSQQFSYQNEESIIQENDFSIINLNQLFNKLKTIVIQVQQLTYLQKGWSLILLHEFKWDINLLKEGYYNNTEGYLNSIGFRNDLKNPQDFSEAKGQCEVCLSNVSIYSNICGHSFCLQCWINNLKNTIQQGSAFPHCMSQDCQCPILFQTSAKMIQLHQQGQSLLAKLQKQICKSFTTTNRNYQFCTGIGCENYIQINNTQIDTVKCTCGKAFCFRCQSDDHYPASCCQKNQWIIQQISNEANIKWISQNTKLCPFCKEAVQKSDGLNLMTCICGQKFCYICSQSWKADQKDHFKCYLQEQSSANSSHQLQEIMQKMNHHPKHYFANQKIANYYKQIDVSSKRKHFHNLLHIDLTETQFLDNAYKCVIECCQKVKWIYVSSYFHDLNHQNSSFLFSIAEVQKYKEHLLKLLASDFQNFMVKMEQYSQVKLINCFSDQLMTQFNQLKEQIINYSNCTKKFMEQFIKEFQLMGRQ